MGETASIPVEAEALPIDSRERNKLFERVHSMKATKADYRLAAQILRETPEVSPGYTNVKGFMNGRLSFLVSWCVGPHVDNEIDWRMLEADARNEAADMDGLDEAVKQWQEKHARERVFASLTKNHRGMTSAPKLDRDGLDRRLERAQRMYLAAIKALADAQKLPPPTVQIAAPGSSIVNLAEKQINLSTS